MKKAEIRTLVDHFDHVRAQNTYEWAKDIRVTGGDPGHIEMTFTTDIRRHANLRGDLHGAVCAGFSDSVMGTACFTLGKSVVTLELKGNFLKAVKPGGVLRGVGRVEHNGKRTMVTTGRIYDEVGDLVYMASGTFYVIDTYELPELPWRL